VEKLEAETNALERPGIDYHNPNSWSIFSTCDRCSKGHTWTTKKGANRHCSFCHAYNCNKCWSDGSLQNKGGYILCTDRTNPDSDGALESACWERRYENDPKFIEARRHRLKIADLEFKNAANDVSTRLYGCGLWRNPDKNTVASGTDDSPSNPSQGGSTSPPQSNNTNRSSSSRGTVLGSDDDLTQRLAVVKRFAASLKKPANDPPELNSEERREVEELSRQCTAMTFEERVAALEKI